MAKEPRRPNTPGRPEEWFARGFEFYLDGRHGTFCGQVHAAAYLFHLAVELMLKSVLLTPVHEAAMTCIDAARKPVEEKLGPEVVRAAPDRLRLDPNVADACLEPYRRKVDELRDAYVHRLIPLWRAAKSQLGARELDRFDSVVNKVSEWEEFRYPVFLHSRGNVLSFNPRKSPHLKRRSRDPVNRYELNREEVDELITALISTVGYSAHWVQMRAGKGQGAGIDTYRRDNRHVTPGA